MPFPLNQDLPDSFAIMEKTKISFARGTETEEAIPCSGYICDYSNLQVKVVMLDEIMKMHLRGVQAPSTDYITIYDNKVTSVSIGLSPFRHRAISGIERNESGL